MIRIGIISFAHVHAAGFARAINNINTKFGLCILAAIADSDEERGKAASKEFAAASFYTDYREMLRSGSIDAVVIDSENCYHTQEAVDSLANNMHVLCDKPVAIAEQQIAQIESAFAKCADKLIFQTAFPCRFAPSSVEAKQLIDSGKLGTIEAISCTNRGKFPGGWFGDKSLSGGGAIMDHTVHGADLVKFFTGETLENVRCYQARNIRPELQVEDAAIVYAKTAKSGIPVSIDCSWSRPNEWPTWGDFTMSLFCRNGVIKLDLFAPHVNLVAGGEVCWDGSGEDTNEKIVASFCAAILEKQGRKAQCGPLAIDSSLRCGLTDSIAAARVAIQATSNVISSRPF